MANPEQETRVDERANFKNGFFASQNDAFDMGLVAATHPGKVRSRNEDHFAVFRRTRTCDMLLSNLPSDDVALVEDHAYGLLVADGIGGAEFGDFASQLAIETLLQAAGLATSWVMKFNDLDSQKVKERTAAYVDRIQEAFREYAPEAPGMKSMGTTLTAAYLIPPHAVFSQIGDSRAYVFRSGKLTQITRDQTLAQSLMDRGAEKEQVSGLGHILVNNLGSGRDHVDVVVSLVELQPGDRLLLCTDGLSDMVSDELIAESLKEDDLQTACDVLLELALAAGGRDNITLIIGEIKLDKP
jgi:protein phosphatase